MSSVLSESSIEEYSTSEELQYPIWSKSSTSFRSFQTSTQKSVSDPQSCAFSPLTNFTFEFDNPQEEEIWVMDELFTNMSAAPLKVPMNQYAPEADLFSFLPLVQRDSVQDVVDQIKHVNESIRQLATYLTDTAEPNVTYGSRHGHTARAVDNLLPFIGKNRVLSTIVCESRQKLSELQNVRYALQGCMVSALYKIIGWSEPGEAENDRSVLSGLFEKILAHCAYQFNLLDAC
jgi:hypothetical protein